MKNKVNLYYLAGAAFFVAAIIQVAGDEVGLAPAYFGLAGAFYAIGTSEKKDKKEE